MAKLIEITGKPLSGEWGSDDIEGTGIPVLRTTNFTNEGVVNYNDVVTRQIKKKNLSEKMLRYGDIVLEKSGGSDKQPVGRVIFFEGEENKYLFNNFTGLLRIKDTSKWLPKYVFYALFANYLAGGTLRYENRTTGLHNLQTDSYVAAVEIPERSIDEQMAIVAHLDKVTQIISLQRMQAEKLDQLIKSRFIELFIGKGYPTKTVDEVSLGKGEYGAQSASIEYDPTRPRYVRITDINDDGTLNDDVVASINPDDDEQYRLEYGDFVFARMGATVGKTYAFITGNQIFAGYLIRYKLNQKLINPRYLFWYTKLDEYWNWVKLNQSGAAQPGINAKKYGSLRIPVPPIEQQEQFAAFVEHTDKSKLAVQQGLQELEILKKSLMQQYFG